MNLINRYMVSKRIYYSLMTIIISAVIIIFSSASYSNIESIILKNAEISSIFEKWLIVKNETVKYIAPNQNTSFYDQATADLIRSVSDYEIAMEKIIDQNILNFIRKSDKSIIDEISKMVLIWQDIQFKLVLSVFYADNIDLFTNEIFIFITETDEFEISMKKTLRSFDSYLHKSIKLYWQLFSLSIFISFILILLFSNLTYNYAKILEKEKKIRELSHSLIKIKDKERTRIAIDLHDVIVQNMLLIKQYCSEGFSNNKKTIKDAIEKTITSVREISFNLRPPELSEDLKQSIDIYCNDVTSSTGINTDFLWIGMDNYKLDEIIEITIYRLIHEAVNNIIKHAGATRIIIRIILSYPNVLLKIEDNGAGFDYNDEDYINKDSNHMGIWGMRERASLINATMNIRSVKNIGTFLVFKIPCTGLIYEQHNQ